jgi:small GTP-binding protein
MEEKRNNPKESGSIRDDLKFTGELWDKIMEEIRKVSDKYDAPVRIAIVGFGKSGKSTLFNAIFGRDIQETGAQTDLTREDKEASRFGIIFTDTRGFGTKLVSVEEIKRALHDQNLIIHCINGMTAIAEEDVDLYGFCKDTKKHVIVAVTKADVMKEREIAEYRASLLEKLDSSLEPVFISAETGLNMKLLIERIINLLPDAAKDAFIAKQQIDPDTKQRRSRQLVHGTAVLAAAVAVSPVPVSDVIILIPMQAGMVISIGAIYGYKLTAGQAKEILVVTGGGIVFRYAYQVLVKFLPGWGSLIGPVVAYSGTIAIGEAALAYFRSGTKATPEEIAKVYEGAKEKAERDFKASRELDILKVRQEEIKTLNEKLSKGEISQEEYEKRIKELLE